MLAKQNPHGRIHPGRPIQERDSRIIILSLPARKSMRKINAKTAQCAFNGCRVLLQPALNSLDSSCDCLTQTELNRVLTNTACAACGACTNCRDSFTTRCAECSLDGRSITSTVGALLTGLHHTLVAVLASRHLCSQAGHNTSIVVNAMQRAGSACLHHTAR